MTTDENARLARAAAAGDRDALGLLWAAHRPWLIAVAMAHTPRGVEVEDVLQQMEFVEDVAVTGEANPLTGQIVLAAVKLSRSESSSAFRKRMRTFCRGRLERFKIPQKVVLVEENFHGGRFKKLRRGTA